MQLQSELLFTTVENVVDTVFSKPPKEPCTYNLIVTDSPFDDVRIAMFPFLMQILITGAKKLFGNQITPQTLTSMQFEKLQSYMLSLGYQIKYNYSQKNDNTFVNIWFQPYTQQRNCHGNIVY